MWSVGDTVRNPKNGFTWVIAVIDRGWARLIDKHGNAHMRPLSDLAKWFEKS